MNIVIYAHYQPPQPSASATRMLSLARHLRAQGCSVTLLTSLAGPADVDGIPIARVDGRKGLIRWLASHERCTLFVSSPPATPAAEVAWAGRLLGYRVMVDIRDPSVIEALKLGDMRPGLATRIKGALEKSLPRAGHAVSFVSEALRDEFANFADFSHPHTVIAPNGVDLSVFSWSLFKQKAARELLRLKDEPVFCYQGILGGKELDRVVEALAPALKAGAKLMIIGIVDEFSRPIKDALHAQLASLGVEKQLIWRENQSLQAMATLLPAADIGINPLPEHRAYCLPVKTYEYMAAGLYNLAHGAADGALTQQLPELAGRVVQGWDAYATAALDCAAKVEQLRKQAPLRAELAKRFSRQTANDRLCRALGSL